MIISIAVNGRHDIGMDSYGRFMVQGMKVSKKRVPFVRYRMEHYGDNEVEYIKRMQEKFSYSVHLAEITLTDRVKEDLETVRGMGNVAKFLYIDIDDKDVTGGLVEEKKELLKLLIGENIDRLMLRDRSTTLFSVAAERLKKEVNDLGLKISDIGICQSPLSVDGNQCLSAVKSREIAAKYGIRDDIPLPTANHEGGQNCGCIRYHLVTESIPAPEGTKSIIIIREVDKKNDVIAKKKKVSTKNVFIKW